jgi:preprotein translocase subunit SecG
MIHTIVLIFHVLACLALVLIVLLQTGRGAEMGAAFGGSSQTLFGSSGGTTFFGKLTTLAAVVFMLTCLGLTYFSGRPDTKSVMEKVQVEEEQGPVLPEAKPVQALPAAPAAPVAPTPAPDAAKAEPAAVADKAPASAVPAAQRDKAKEAGAPQTPAKPAAPARKP